MRTRRFLLAMLAAGTAVAAARAQTDPLTVLRQAFQAPPADSRIMMRWWWFGPSVTKPELARELETMKAGGIGGVEIQPVYPLEPDDEAKGIRNLPFLSDDFVDTLRYTNDVARQLGLRVDLTLGSGWPYGGPTVGVDHAAGKLRIERVNPGALPPEIGPGERLIAQAPASDGSGATLVFISSRTGMMVKRAAAGAEGYVLDHYDRGALDAYLDLVGNRLLRAFDGAPPYAIFCDSLEVFESDWTPDFLDQFKARRGYDLTPHLPALASTAENSAAVRHDWGQTLTELARERFVAPLQAWARAGNEAPHAGLRHATRDGVEHRRRRPVRRRRRAMEGAVVDALGVFHQSSRRRARHLVGDVDLAAFAGLPRVAARHEGRGGPPLPPGRQPADRSRLALHPARHRGSGLALLRRGGLQRAQSLVDRHARRRALPAARQLRPAPGRSRHRRRALSAGRRRVGGVHAGARSHDRDAARTDRP